MPPRRATADSYARRSPEGHPWGWNEGETHWIPPQYAGVDVDVDLLAGWVPNPVTVEALYDALLGRKRNVHCCASRRGGKTNLAGRLAALVARRRSDEIRAGNDSQWSPERFDGWFEDVVGQPGSPRKLVSSDLDDVKWPCPCVAISPVHSLTRLQRNELTEIFRPWRHELGVLTYQGGKTMVIMALGIRLDFVSADRAEVNVGTGNVLLWAGEAARIKPDTWEHILPTVMDRGGSLISDTTPWGGKNPSGYFGQLWARGDAQAAEDVERPHRYEPDRTVCYHWTADQNLAVPDLAEEMERDRKSYGENSAYFRRTWLASWELPEGMCWPMFDKRRHIRTACWDDYDLWVAGQDWGFSEREGGHPGALLIAGVSRSKPRRVHVFRAYYGSGILVTPSDGTAVEGSQTWKGFATEALGEIRENTGSRAVITGYGGPDRPEAISAMVGPGLGWRAASHVSVDGIEDVERLLVDDATLGGPRLTFDPAVERRAPGVIRDIQSARWATDSRGRSLPRFDKDTYDPHGGEALVYLVQSIRNILDLSSPAYGSAVRR